MKQSNIDALEVLVNELERRDEDVPDPQDSINVYDLVEGFRAIIASEKEAEKAEPLEDSERARVGEIVRRLEIHPDVSKINVAKLREELRAISQGRAGKEWTTQVCLDCGGHGYLRPKGKGPCNRCNGSGRLYELPAPRINTEPERG
ncbi:hypothetical protein OAF54_01125 [bacterium]|nr:hypothetical protein [bacterium]